MTVCIFLGPSLPVDYAREFLPAAVFLPPVQQGDVYAAMHSNSPSIIGIIDGYFQQRPSVWHKEILWAMSQGVHVYGAASMGALRAAELAPYGMIGVGAIFEAFHSGALPPFKGLVDDDEVALVHGPPETGYLAISEALVNIRHTLAAALAQQVIDEHTHDELVAQARLTHFSERNYASLFAQAHDRGLCRKTLVRLESWLPGGRIDQKRNDAILLLQRVAELVEQAKAPLQVHFNFEKTEIWRDTVTDIQARRSVFEESDTLRLAIIDELRLNPENYLNVKQAALLHCTVESDENSDADRLGTTKRPASEVPLREVVQDYRLKNSLLDRDSVDLWLKNNDMQVSDFDEMMKHEGRFRSAMDTPDTPEIVEALIARLRLTGDYPAIARRAREKLVLVSENPAETISKAQLIRWYFRQTPRQDIPDDIQSYARSLGLHDEAEFIRLLGREHAFLSKRIIDTERCSNDGV